MSGLNLYESPALRAVTGPVLRPGGFELTDRGLSCCGLPPGARVLDIGCGTGAAVDYLRHHHGFAAVGLDLSFRLLQEGSKNCGSLPLVAGHAQRLPMVSGSLDAVLCECVLSLCPDPLEALCEITRVLRPGGQLVLSDVYARMPLEAAANPKPVVRSCLSGAVERPVVDKRFAAAGFDGLLWEDHTPLLKGLAAQLVWTYGTLAAFWSAVGLSPSDACRQSAAVGGCRPGYYLAVVRKPD